MHVTRLVLQEIGHRPLNFGLSLLSVTIAVACVIGAGTLLDGDERQTQIVLEASRQAVEAAVADQEASVAQAGRELEDAIRRQMLGLGFNVLILPEQQDLSELHLDGTLSETMPESYVDKLASSSIVTVNHLLPSVTRRVVWEHNGQQLDVIVQGTRGEVPILHRNEKKPLLEAVSPGTMVVGWQVHQQLGLQAGDTVSLLGEEFRITKLHPQRGSSDDVTVWIDLKQAQELLGMQNLIHAILALECECAGDRISQIRAEIQNILPGTQVVERWSTALARAESRAQAKSTAQASLDQARAAGAAAIEREAVARASIQQRHADLSGVLVPLVMVACAVWIAVLALTNARQRTNEIGILRAIGISSRRILMLFTLRAGLIGVLGGLLGTVVGVASGIPLSGRPLDGEEFKQLLGSDTGPLLILAGPLAAPAFSILASWLPVMLTASGDPATALQADQAAS